MSRASNTFSRARWVFGVGAAIAIGLAVPIAAHAEAAPADPIDSAMRNCLARADRSSPAGQAQCMDAARESWSASMELAYDALVAHAPDETKRSWQESQRRWLEWHQREVPLVRAVTQTTRGSFHLMTQANVLLQPVRDRALQLRRVAAQHEPAPASTSGAASASAAASAPVAAVLPAVPAPASVSVQRTGRLRACTVDAACEHALSDLNRYARKLRMKLPVRSRPVLARAQKAWRSYFEATSSLGSARDRVDLIGARVATIKRLAEMAGND